MTKLYTDKKNVTLIDEKWISRNIKETIGTDESKDPIVMIGDGYSGGMYAPLNDRKFGRLIVNGSIANHLKDKLCIGLWPDSIEYAKRYKLKGIFLGDFIFTETQASRSDFNADEKLINKLNREFVEDLSYCLRHYSLNLIPTKMQELMDYDSRIKAHNYKNFFFHEVC